MDPHFTVEVVSQTPNPQQTIYAAMHQDYSEDFVFHGRANWPSESWCGETAVNRLLRRGQGHWGPLEHTKIMLNVGWFPHSTMQQLRTHRHLSFDVQSGRYTGKRVCDVVTKKRTVEEVFYLRPVGDYRDRRGKRYTYTQTERDEDIQWCELAAVNYKDKLGRGHSEEHARGCLPFDIRQHWMVSANMRALTHLLTIRGKADVQLEAVQFCELVLPHFQAWAPEIYRYFEDHQWRKGRLAP